MRTYLYFLIRIVFHFVFTASAYVLYFISFVTSHLNTLIESTSFVFSTCIGRAKRQEIGSGLSDRIPNSETVQIHTLHLAYITFVSACFYFKKTWGKFHTKTCPLFLDTREELVLRKRLHFLWDQTHGTTKLTNTTPNVAIITELEQV